MTFTQSITPNPDIWCRPGYCLEYVRSTYGLPIRYNTATDAWNNSATQHHDQNFPAGVWIPLWFAIPGIPAGHVVLRAPDGSIYSTSDESNTPHHHPSLDDLIWYYGARVQPEYQLELQYLGWTEDVAGFTVITQESETDMTPNETAMLQEIHDRVLGRDVQRWFNPTTMEVRTEPFDGAIPARSTDIHDVISTNNWIAQNIQRVLEAFAASPGMDPALVARLKTELTSILTDATKNLSVTLTTK